ncbi:hypothetical protein [uncultured Piscinibacter sp.]|uniref:hypothetical protein n=1 Tax=uncultured Piscinibacter sp. TaxID=1131835 RepID=UPI002609FD6C|nr:hypothetical protein [uncultured Piscinibacter sp.]
MRQLTVLSLALAAVSLPCAADAAGDKLKLGIFGNGKGSGPLLTRAELRECFALQDRVKTGGEAAASERDQLEKEKAGLMQQREDIKVELDKLDLANAAAVEQHKERAMAHDKAIEDFVARSNQFNIRVSAIEADRASFRQKCDNRRFDQLDEAALRKGK